MFRNISIIKIKVLLFVLKKKWKLKFECAGDVRWAFDISHWTNALVFFFSFWLRTNARVLFKIIELYEFLLSSNYQSLISPCCLQGRVTLNRHALISRVTLDQHALQAHFSNVGLYNSLTYLQVVGTRIIISNIGEILF